jgi:ABC-type multidrug transport system ATPase subunit
MAQLPNFGAMLEVLESRLEALGASSYGLAMNSLEDVFVTISEREAAKAAAEASETAGVGAGKGDAAADVLATVAGRNVTEEFAAAAHQGGGGRFAAHVATVMTKRALVWKRSPRLWFMAIVLPAVFFVGGYMAAFSMGNQYSGGSWHQKVDDFDHLSVAVFVQPAQQAHAHIGEVDRLLTAASAAYAAMRARQNVSGQLSFDLVTDAWEQDTWAWLTQTNIAMSTRHDMPVAMAVEHIDLARGQLNYTHLSTWNADPRTVVYLDMMFRAAALTLKTGVAAEPNMQVVPFPPGVEPDSIVTAAPWSYTAPPGSTPRMPRYSVMITFMLVVMGVAQFCSSNAVYVADEVNKKTFMALRVHGISGAAYWAGTLLADAATSVFLFGVAITMPFINPLPQLQTGMIFYGVVALLLLVLNALLQAYLVVVILPENSKRNTYIAAVTGATVALVALPYMIELIIGVANYNNRKGDPEYEDVGVAWTYYLSPQRLFLAGMSYTPPENYATTTKPWSDDDQCWYIVAMACWLVAPIGFLALYTHFDVIERHRQQRKQAAAQQACEGDRLLDQAAPIAAGVVADDVAAEHRRVVEDRDHEDMVTVTGVRREFGTYGALPCNRTGTKVAVADLTLGVKKGECFGLLGPNGAGKTTTVKMMMQELVPTRGAVAFPYTALDTAAVRSSDATYVRAALGACLQHDSLWGHLTAREHMALYLRARLGGRYRAGEWAAYVEAALKRVGLDDTGNKAAEQFSGGMKRKLAVCIAMFTGGQAVFLDEPSTGMDPYARRALWKSIHEATAQERCVLLTTHSMEEADAVCGRIAIVTNGLMQCVGSGQHLKATYGKGYTVTLLLQRHADELGDDAVAAAREAAAAADDELQRAVDAGMTAHFGGACELKEVLGAQRRYAIAGDLKLPAAFATLADRREAWRLSSYGVNQTTTLDQIFVQFAGEAQHDQN